ncbi:MULTISPECIES: SURF1 family protein [Bradyrhizobium]|uniref:SURF1 family protein n=1 Tax=Bradyrhizobium TaxID=374 RepID=UPI00155E5C7E|nr:MULTISPECIES: SURF1 family protein [Bradyrhizobium]MDD1519415.1 surfeit locus 1 family protein [Bradyrhizobium sp. WBAH30]MDD1543659.1 surfeit locus 1 family protein [Bradyrhizobium sp. WBAH41]MDD1558056.1 surfeit locus 1 family protein [Bradyrhizobium sp. WBAH23]MDD1565468.1 surfeit locus 1 family protein [Bradyrhizobium sp. WBAH33]MDD1592710.1 surfeit locus 1 family protein [Bradyrhizobium sp. WBAH42]
MNDIGTVTGKDVDARSEAARSPSLWLTVLSLVAFVILIALGVWQVERRAWKLALIDRVEQRVHAPAQPIPSPAAWPAVSAASDEYRHVSLSGRFLHEGETLVQAVTEEGPGYWVLTPLQRDDGTLVLINRGFVPSERRDASTRRDGNPEGRVEITGLLRVTEPKGGFLRNNVPQHNRWYSRDVAAIAAARGLREVAPFFVDADAGSQIAGGPIGGLTVIRFPNNHLIYALTWFALAFMLTGRLFVTFGGGLFRRRRFVHDKAGGSDAVARRTGSDAGTIVEPT